MKHRIRLLAAAIGVAAAAIMPAAVAHADTYGELFHWVDVMAAKYGMGEVYVGVQPMAPGVYGETTGSTIMFNTAYVQNPAKLTADLASDVQYGYHPGAQCTATQVLAAHESAHVLDNITGRTARLELRDAVANGLSGELSGYSFKNGDLNVGEALADAMVAVECDTPTEAEMALYTMLTT